MLNPSRKLLYPLTSFGKRTPAASSRLTTRPSSGLLLTALWAAQARRKGEAAAAEERRALLGSGDPLARLREREGRDGLVGTAAAATASLQRTRQLMTQVCTCAPGSS